MLEEVFTNSPGRKIGFFETVSNLALLHLNAEFSTAREDSECI